jgi:Leucine-rich repeat (LRR) protein
LESLVNPIANIVNLEELDLSNNLFTRLPPDLSSWKFLANLNLTGIVFENFHLSIKAVATLPNIKSLYLNLSEESQVDFIIKHLPKLEFLNGLPVDRDTLN